MTLIVDLGPEHLAVLQFKAESEGLSIEECAGKLLEEALLSEANEPAFSDRLREIWRDMPDEVRAKLPVDGASEHDHYIYGVPKRNG